MPLIDVGIIEKLTALKNKYLGEHPDALKQIREWEERVQTLARQKELLENDSVRKIYDDLKKGVKDEMRFRIQKGRTSDELEVSSGKQESLEWALGMFNLDYQAELDTIESLIDQEL